MAYDRMYSVTLVWKYHPDLGDTRRPFFVTATYITMATSEAQARTEVAAKILPDCTSQLYAKARTERGMVVGETVRRCRHNRWDAHAPDSFTLMRTERIPKE